MNLVGVEDLLKIGRIPSITYFYLAINKIVHILELSQQSNSKMKKIENNGCRKNHG